MARYVDAKCRLCRKEGLKLFIKGFKCGSEKCPFVKRPTPPGMHVRAGLRKPSNYSLQLREKQKVKRTYGLLERQFARFFRIATKSRGVTGRTLLQLLERRLDNVVYRALFSFSRNQARQMVLHGFAFIKGKRVNIPSYLIRPDEVIEIRANDAIKKTIKENIEINSKERSVSDWLEVDKDNLTIKILRLPEKEDVGMPVNEQLIVELYSK